MTQLEHYLEHLQRFGIRPGLERMRALLQTIGNPQAQYPVVLVGGTNGKGSTCEFLARGLAREGKTVGLYTSPHLYKWNERLRVLDVGVADQNGFAGTPADDELDALFNALKPQIEAVAASENGQPTEFETLTFLGLQHFALRRVDVAVVEVGLGGRFDATNVCEPLVSVVTHVALDHCDRLGNTHVEIARDKVCIARAGCILVTSETRDDVLEVFRAHCEQIGARLWSFRDVEYSNDRAALEEAVFDAEQFAPQQEIEFQQLNARTAHIARVALSHSDKRFEIDQAARAKSLSSQRDLQTSQQFQNATQPLIASQSLIAVPGRFQIVRDDPMLILDGANNPEGAQFLASQLRRVLDARPNSRLTLVLGILRDKDYAAMIALLAPLAHRIIATQSSSPRACEAAVIANHARRFCAHVEEIASVQAAVERALTLSTRSDIVCATGSFYTVAEIKFEK